MQETKLFCSLPAIANTPNWLVAMLEIKLLSLPAIVNTHNWLVLEAKLLSFPAIASSPNWFFNYASSQSLITRDHRYWRSFKAVLKLIPIRSSSRKSKAFISSGVENCSPVEWFIMRKNYSWKYMVIRRICVHRVQLYSQMRIFCF